MIVIPPYKNFDHSDVCYAKEKPTPKKINSLPTQRT